MVDGRFYNDYSMEIYNLDTDTWSKGVDFSFSCTSCFRACTLKYEISDLAVINNNELKIVEAPKQNKHFSFLSRFKTEK